MRTLPEIVIKLTHNFDGYIVGSAADPDNTNPRDYDIMIPFHLWHQAVSLIPKTSTPNSFGGWKFIDNETGKEIDIWPGDLGWICQRPMFKYAYHPLTNTRIQKI